VIPASRGPEQFLLDYDAVKLFVNYFCISAQEGLEKTAVTGQLEPPGHEDSD
jgi:hypothetical protein